MTFACIYIANFLVQAAVRAEPALGEKGLALIEGAPPLESVVGANAAALRAGIQLGMTKGQVAAFCGVEIRERSEAQERAAHAALLDAAWSMSPRVEDTAADTVTLDLAGLEPLFGAEEKIARELMQRVARMGLAAQIAVAGNIETAIHAARGFAGITIIPRGEERKRLSGLPVRVFAASGETLEVLQRWGVETFADLAALPILDLSERLGQEGVRLHELARGARKRSLKLAAATTTCEEEMELDDAVEELEPLSFLLGRLLDQLCARLEGRALAARAIRVRFELEPSFEKDFQTLKGDCRKKAEARRYHKVLTLPVPMRDAKMLLKLLRLQLQSDPPSAPIVKIALAADAAARRVVQGGLFTPCAPDAEKLELTIARLGKLVGAGNVGAPELMDSHRPDGFRMGRFAAVAETNVRRRKENAAGEKFCGAARVANAVTGFRVMRPARAIAVELRKERPVRVRLAGIRGDVVAVSGPWRSSGDWWQEDAWRQDEWDVALHFRAAAQAKGEWPEHGVYRIFYDAVREGWFVRGIYD